MDDQNYYWKAFIKETSGSKTRWLGRQLYGRDVAFIFVSTQESTAGLHQPSDPLLCCVHASDVSRVQEIFSPVDDLPDDDPCWEKELAEMCDCEKFPAFILDSFPPKCGVCGKFLYLLVGGK